MTRRRSRTERNGKDEAPAASSDLANTASPMNRFKSLARRIINVPRKEYDISELLKRITPENLHEEADFGRPVGKEAW